MLARFCNRLNNARASDCFQFVKLSAKPLCSANGHRHFSHDSVFILTTLLLTTLKGGTHVMTRRRSVATITALTIAILYKRPWRICAAPRLGEIKKSGIKKHKRGSLIGSPASSESNLPQ